MKLNDCIYFLTTRLSRELRKQFDDYLSKIDLTASGWCVLMCIIEHNESITQKEIADILALETPTVTRILDILQKKGFINRIPHPQDRRCFIIKLTEKGKSMKNEIFLYGECFMKSVANFITESEFKLFKDILEKLYHNIKDKGLIYSCK